MTQLNLTLTPESNTRLANLCGILDENITQIATTLQVHILRRGAVFKLDGNATSVTLAARFLEQLYTRAEVPLSLAEIRLGLIELEKLPSIPIKAETSLLSRRGEVRARTPRQATYLQQIQSYDITFGIGPAGTGKTYLAVASAVDALNRNYVQRLILVRPAVEAGERLGFLPGDFAQKVDPYLRPLYDALYDLAGYDAVHKMLGQNVIEIAPLAYMRGRTLNESFVILDEAQNTTQEQMKMFLTRIGFSSKLVVTGDVTQIDLQRHQKSGLVEAQQILKAIDGIAMTHFIAEDVVRHPLVQKIVNAYSQYENNN